MTLYQEMYLSKHNADLVNTQDRPDLRYEDLEHIWSGKTLDFLEVYFETYEEYNDIEPAEFLELDKDILDDLETRILDDLAIVSEVKWGEEDPTLDPTKGFCSKKVVMMNWNQYNLESLLSDIKRIKVIAEENPDKYLLYSSWEIL